MGLGRIRLGSLSRVFPIWSALRDELGWMCSDISPMRDCWCERGPFWRMLFSIGFLCIWRMLRESREILWFLDFRRFWKSLRIRVWSLSRM